MPFEPLDQYEQRRKKRDEIAALGFDPFPTRFDATETVADVLARHGGATGEQLETAQIHVRLAGRLMTLRLHGKAGFAHIQGAGARLQIYVKLDVVGEKLFALFRLLDLGDIVGVRGHLFRTKTGELTVWVSDLALLSKALLPPPEKWHGLTDVEQRYRQRYVDLFANEGVREIFLKRAQIIRETRAFFDARGYIEVETPMMHPIAGGAAARPFVTHHNTYDVNLYLRIAPELYLKRLIVGGLDRVYEINRNFRNEGVGYRWNPEFTMLEFYEAYSDYRALMDLTERLVTGIVQKVNGSLAITYGQHTVDFSRWHRLTMREAIVACWPAAAGAAPAPPELASQDGLRAAAARYNAAARPESGIEPVHKPDAMGHGELTAALFEGVCERRLIQPTLIYDFPTEVSPLSKRKPEDPSLVERFEFFAGGLELGNAFSELNDPEDQETRFRQQMARGGEEAPKEVDLDYIRALCYGMPPTAGEGIGIDRLAMLLTNSHSIREVILFPLLRPEAATPAAGEAEPGTP